MENKKCQTLVRELITKYLAFFICDPVGSRTPIEGTGILYSIH